MEGDGTNILFIYLLFFDNIVLCIYVVVVVVLFFFLIFFFTCGCFCWFVCLLLSEKNIVLETIMWTSCLEPLIFFFPIFTF